MIEAKGFKKVQAEIAWLKRFMLHGDKPLMDAIGKFALKMMLKRTRSGLDKDGRSFKKKKDGSPSTLQKSGKMLRDMHYEASAKVVRIYVGTRVRGRITNFNLMVVHARGLKAGRGTGFHMPRRDPMGFSTREINQIRLHFKKLLITKLKRIA